MTPPSSGSLYLHTVKPVFRCHLWEKEIKLSFKTGDLLIEVQFI